MLAVWLPSVGLYPVRVHSWGLGIYFHSFVQVILRTLLFLLLSACTTVLSFVQNSLRVGASLDNVVPVNLPTIKCRRNRT
jgi:hypothetical protein